MGRALGRFQYTKGLHDLGSGGYAWRRPDGGWGWSNAGLVVDGGESYLIDTLFDVPLTHEMLDAMKKAEPKAAARAAMAERGDVSCEKAAVQAIREAKMES